MWFDIEESLSRGGGGMVSGHLYSKVDMMLVHGLTK